MRPIRHHAKPVMTKAQNRTAFVMWLNGCTDHALESAALASLARSYGLDVTFVEAEIRKEIGRRKFAAALNAQRLGEPS